MPFFIVYTSYGGERMRVLPTYAPDWETLVTLMTKRNSQEPGKEGVLVQVNLVPDVVEEIQHVLSQIVGVPPQFTQDEKQSIEGALSFQLEYFWALMDREDHEVVRKSSDVCEIDEDGIPESVESVESVLQRYGLVPHDEGEANRADMLTVIKEILKS